MFGDISYITFISYTSCVFGLFTVHIVLGTILQKLNDVSKQLDFIESRLTSSSSDYYSDNSSNDDDETSDDESSSDDDVNKPSNDDVNKPSNDDVNKPSNEENNNSTSNNELQALFGEMVNETLDIKRCIDIILTYANGHENLFDKSPSDGSKYVSLEFINQNREKYEKYNNAKNNLPLALRDFKLYFKTNLIGKSFAAASTFMKDYPGITLEILMLGNVMYISKQKAAALKCSNILLNLSSPGSMEVTARNIQNCIITDVSFPDEL